MTRLITHITMGALAGAVMGAVALFILAEGLPEGAIAGALIGASMGALMASRIYAHRAAIATAKRDPATAARQARLRDTHSIHDDPSLQRHQLRETIDRASVDSHLQDR